MQYLITVIGLFLSSLSLTLASPALVPAPPQLPSSAYLLLDHNSGRVLASHNSDARVEPASITKLMTVYIAFDALRNGSINKDDKVRISHNARYRHVDGSRMFVEHNSLVSMQDLLMGVIVQSGNDASIAIAEHIAGNEEAFAVLMNNYAQRLGMHNSNFVNSSGWPQPDHYMTAEDIAILSSALIRDFPDQYAMYRIKNFTHNNIRQPNRNRLLWLDERVDGLKTGHTESAGFCLVSSATHEDMRLIAVVMGTDSERAREAASRTLLNYGFRFFETFVLHGAHEALTEMRIWKGRQESVPLGLQQPLYVTIPRGQRNRVQAQMNIDSMIMAPAHKGEQYGTVNVTLQNELLVSQPLVALADVPEGGFWRKLIDNIKLMFN